MCGRFTLSVDPDELRERFDLLVTPEFEPRYNIAPTQPIAIVRQGPEFKFLDLVRWGLVPSWSASMEGPPLINARSETIFKKPSFKESIEQRRCIVPADGYFEWKSVSGYKQPYHIRLKNRNAFAMAGIWDTWIDSEGGEVISCAIVTAKSNSLTEGVHTRMPVILPTRSWDAWLDRSEAGDGVKEMFVPFASSQMEMEPVSPLVNRVVNDTAECLKPAEVNFELDV